MDTGVVQQCASQLLLVFIVSTYTNGQMSWPRQLVTNWDSWPICWRSPFQVLNRSEVD